MYCLSKHWSNFTFPSYAILNCSKLFQVIDLYQGLVLTSFSISVRPVFRVLCLFLGLVPCGLSVQLQSGFNYRWKLSGGSNLNFCHRETLKSDISVGRGKRARVESHSQTEMNCQPLQHQEKRTRNNEIFSSLSSSRNMLNHRKTRNKRKSSTTG